MGKTRAQYQKEYRERKKKNDKEFLKKERERTKHYKLPIGALSEEKRRELQEKNRNWKRKSRENMRRKIHEADEKEDRTRNSEAQTQSDKADNSQDTQQSSTEGQLFTVKLDFKPRQRSQKRSKALGTASRRIKNLEEKLKTLNRENKKLRKRMKDLEYVFYNGDEYDETAKELEMRNPKTIPGTMKLHALFPKENLVYKAEVSCYCATCVKGEPCRHCKTESFLEKSSREGKRDRRPPKRKSDETELNDNENRRKIQKVDLPGCSASEEDSLIRPRAIDTFFLVKWDDVIYSAKVLEVDDRKHEAKVSFMEEARQRGDVKLFKWPERDDIQKVDYEQFGREIQEPTPCSKSKRQFKLQDIDYMFFDTE